MMNKKNVLTCAGGGGAPHNRVNNGGENFIPKNYRCSCSDNAAVAHWQH